MRRRTIITSLPLLATATMQQASASNFEKFVGTLHRRARQDGIPSRIADAALTDITPNQAVIKLDQHQPEFTLTWKQYRALTVTPVRIANGRQELEENADVIAAVTRRFGVQAAPIMGIWGIESNFGRIQGSFHVVDALVTLAWFDNSEYFTNEVIAAMRIAARGDAPLSMLRGSWAGAMGQPQFMPSVYLDTAIDFSGRGRPNIWTSIPDSLASIANYLHKAGWRAGFPSSEQVLLPDGFDDRVAGENRFLSLRHWQALGVQRLPSAVPLPGGTKASLLLPDGSPGAAFLVYANFRVIRRYNASDLYALAVGDLGRSILG